MKIAIVPVSYDPITLGHLDVVERASKIFDQVIVAVMINDQKQYRFTMEQKTELAQVSCAHIPNVRVVADKGLLVDLVASVGACAIIKGLRSQKDFCYEQPMAYWNREHNPDAETLYLPCDKKYKRVSSTAVRRRLEEGKDLCGLLSPAAIELLCQWGIACPKKKETSKF